MSIATEDNKVTYNANGSLTEFSFTFPIFDESDLVITHTDDDGVETTLIIGTDYTVEPAVPNDFSGGGSITTVATYETGEKITISRAIPYTQQLDYVDSDPFPAESHEDGLDKLTILAQQIKEQATRCLRFPVSDDVALSPEMATASLRANKYIKMDSIGEPTFVTEWEQGAITVSAFAELLLGDTTAEAMRTRLELNDMLTYELVVDSVADLELLKYGGATQYRSVFIKRGTYTTSEKLDLEAHGVYYLRGETPDTKIIFTTNSDANTFFQLNDSGVVENLTVEVTVAGSNRSIFEPDSVSNTSVIRDVYVFGSGSGLHAHIGVAGVKGGVVNVRAVDVAMGISLCENLANCVAESCQTATGFGAFSQCVRLTNCYAYDNLYVGFLDCTELATCEANSNGEEGFLDCFQLTGCGADSNTGDGFSGCEMVSGCYADGNLNGFLGCNQLGGCRSVSNSADGFNNCDQIGGSYATLNTGNGFDTCSYFAGCLATANTSANYTGSTKQDPDST